MSSKRIVLVVGGTGMVGGPIVDALKAKGLPDDEVRVASRHPSADKSNHVKFDWTDDSTWGAALDGVTATLIIGPRHVDAPSLMNKFVDRALEAGAKRHVLVTGHSTDVNTFFLGEVHRHVADNVPEYVVLRPTQLNENFTTGEYFKHMVNTGGEFSDAFGEGKTGFVAAEDVARSAAEALTLPSDSPLLNNIDGYQLEGPQALSFGQAGEVLAKVTGKKIRYNDIDPETHRANRSPHIPKIIVKILDKVIDDCRNGEQEHLRDRGVQKLTGREPKSFESWCEEIKAHFDVLP